MRGLAHIRKIFRGESGAALVLVLVILSVLSVVVLESLRAMQVETTGAFNHRATIQAQAIAESGLRMFSALLVRDELTSEYDHAGEEWAVFLTEESEIRVEFQSGELSGRVGDESARFPVNILGKSEARAQVGRDVLRRMLLFGPWELEPDEAAEITAAIADWIDGNDETLPGGAEDDYYQSEGLPYHCKNGPLDSLAELLLVRGVGADLYHGSGDVPGLKEFLTIHGGERVNINTAPGFVIQALVPPAILDGTAESFAESVLEFRGNPVNWEYIGGSDWYKEQMAGFRDVTLPTWLITTQTKHFFAELTARVGSSDRRVFCILRREPATGAGLLGPVPEVVVVQMEIL